MALEGTDQFDVYDICLSLEVFTGSTKVLAEDVVPTRQTRSQVAVDQGKLSHQNSTDWCLIDQSMKPLVEVTPGSRRTAIDIASTENSAGQRVR